ncbi:phage major capsid protein [Methylobacterium sp. WSM2598]|uniref:phage major capsid protein n=1 Tax=Methylobacterium sp. WSM2598 TaxID=398261 RepID=UPI00036EB806|nr:phage major capsid protein [Methylobacterium sp. WSM2598]
MNTHVTPGIRAARAAGNLLRQKDATGLDAVIRAIEDNNRAVDARLKSVEQLTSGVAGISDQLTELEQKMARPRGLGTTAAPLSWGEEFTASPELKAFAQETSRPGRLRLEMKTTITSATNSGGRLTTPTRDDVVTLPKRPLVVRDLLPVIPVSSGSVEYPKQTTRTNNAAIQAAEGDAKAESAYAFDIATTPIRTIAHWVPASRQILEDAPQLAGIIDSELRYGLAVREDAQLLSGDGTGSNILGLIPQATAYSAPFTMTAPTMLDQVALAVLQCSLADFPPDGIVMHPSDWMRICLIKDAGGLYLIGAPGSNTPKTLWGLPVVTTTSIAADKFLVGAFQQAATLYDRWAPRVEVSTEHADFFTRNLVAVLAEERIGLAVKRPAALVYGDFGNA